jgi:hypothetical protein
MEQRLSQLETSMHMLLQVTLDVQRSIRQEVAGALNAASLRSANPSALSDGAAELTRMAPRPVSHTLKFPSPSLLPIASIIRSLIMPER